MDSKKALKILNINKIWWPILCGIIITGFLFYKSDKIFTQILSKPNWYYLYLAFLSIILRELGHIYRLRIISNNRLSWISCFYVALLWEFGTAVTPSVVGGGLLAIFLLYKEGLSMGKSISYIIITGIMDNLFFLLAGSLGFLGIYEPIFTMAGSLSMSIKSFFFIVYTFFFIYNLVMTIGIFINPTLLKRILIYVTSRISFLKRWRRSAYQLSKDIIVTSNQFRSRNFIFWVKILLCTLFTWIVRYMLMNFVIAAYCKVPFVEHLDILGKQVVMWVLMLIPISPGGSGIAEFWFKRFFECTLGEHTLLIALLWRIASFYFYLILGIFLLPKWIKNKLIIKENF